MSSASAVEAAPAAALRLFARMLSLSAAAFRLAPGERVVGPMRRGLKIAKQRRVGLSGGPLRCVLMQFDLAVVAGECGVALESLLDAGDPEEAGKRTRATYLARAALALWSASASARSGGALWLPQTAAQGARP
jgi:AraC family transcriptional activator of pyochelin receptor